MILRAICDYSDPALWNLMRSRYNQEDTFLSYYRGTTIRAHYDGRFGSGLSGISNSIGNLSEDDKNLVGAQEVSIYG